MTKEQLEEEAYQYDADHLRGARGARWYHNVTIREAYLAGAEPREKRIAEFEKENAELKDKLENIRRYLDNEIPHELINEATTIIYKMV